MKLKFFKNLKYIQNPVGNTICLIMEHHSLFLAEKSAKNLEIIA